jgi:hypothetical protein
MSATSRIPCRAAVFSKWRGSIRYCATAYSWVGLVAVLGEARSTPRDTSIGQGEVCSPRRISGQKREAYRQGGARDTLLSLSQREAIEAMPLTKHCISKANPATCTVLRKRNRHSEPAGGCSLTALSHGQGMLPKRRNPTPLSSSKSWSQINILAMWNRS